MTVGGSGVGGPLLRRVVEAHPYAAKRVPGLRTVVVTGPRIDPAAVPAPAGVEVRGYVPGLYRLLAACDVAVVQGGLTTTMELTALRRPFLYFPLRHHFEQQIHVAAPARPSPGGHAHGLRHRDARVDRRGRLRPSWTGRWLPAGAHRRCPARSGADRRSDLRRF